MSIAETYLLASKARAKLTKEASKSDHDLRVLVSHANLLDNLMESIHNHKFPQQPTSILNKKSSTPSNLHHTTTVTFVDEDELDDEYESDDDIEEDDELEVGEFGVSYNTIDYDSDDSDDEDYDDEFDSDSDDEYEEEEGEGANDEEVDEDPWRVRFSYNHQNDSSSNFRHMPTIDELSEQELESLESESEVEDEDEEQHNQTGHIEEADIVDIIYSNQPPQLSYSTTDESESEEEEEELQRDEHHDHKYQNEDIFQKQEQLHQEFNMNTTTTEIVA